MAGSNGSFGHRPIIIATFVILWVLLLCALFSMDDKEAIKRSPQFFINQVCKFCA